MYDLPPSELAVHPTGRGGPHELHLMCDGLAGLQSRGAAFVQPVSEQTWAIPPWSARPEASIGLYAPRH